MMSIDVKAFLAGAESDFLFPLLAQGASAVAGDDQEADERQDE